jgi:Holliday junction resolvase
MTGENIYIIKSSGEREAFSEDKLRGSLQRAKVSPELIDDIVRHLRSEIREGMSTSEIYRRAYAILKRHRRSLAARYSLQKAILQLGPTGYPFEILVGEILKHEGFSVEISKVMSGRCVAHEVDVSAVKNNQHIIVECKFHNELGMKSDIKVALYVHARFEDISRAWSNTHAHKERLKEAWLVTNTRLTSDALKYANCVGIKAIDWNYPPGESLSELVDQAGLHPVTSLTSLTREQKKQLMNSGIILCRELFDNPAVLTSIGTNGKKTASILKEIKELCKNGNKI